jgi:hypothetical protein
LALGWTPLANLQDTFEVLLQRTTADGDATVTLDPSGSAPVLGDLTNNAALAQSFRQNTEFFENSLTWSLSNMTLTAVSSASDTYSHQIQDTSATFTSFFPAYTGSPGYAPQLDDIRVHKFTQEIRLASLANDRFDWMVGAFDTYERVGNSQAVYALGTDFQPNALNPLLTVSLPSYYREQAGFGNLDWRVLGGWWLGGGVRYSHNSQTYTQETGGLLTLGPPASGRSSQEVTTCDCSNASRGYAPRVEWCPTCCNRRCSGSSAGRAPCARSGGCRRVAGWLVALCAAQ